MRWACTLGAMLAIVAGGLGGGCAPHLEPEGIQFKIGGGAMPAEDWGLEDSIASGTTFTVTGAAVDEEGEIVPTELVSGDEEVLIPVGPDEMTGAWATFEAGASGRGTVDLVGRDSGDLLGILDLHVRQPVSLDLRLSGDRTPPSHFAVPLGSVMASRVELSADDGRPLNHFGVIEAEVDGQAVEADTGGDVLKLTPRESGSSSVTVRARNGEAAATYHVETVYASSISRIDLAVHQQCGVDEATVIAEMETGSGVAVLGQSVDWTAPDGTLAAMEADAVQVRLAAEQRVPVSASAAGLSASVEVVPMDCEPTACAVDATARGAAPLALGIPALALAWGLRRRSPIL